MVNVSTYVVLVGANGHPSGYAPTVFNFRVGRLVWADWWVLHILGRKDGRPMSVKQTGILATKWALEITAIKVWYSFKERLLEQWKSKVLKLSVSFLQAFYSLILMITSPYNVKQRKFVLSCTMEKKKCMIWWEREGNLRKWEEVKTACLTKGEKKRR